MPLCYRLMGMWSLQQEAAKLQRHKEEAMFVADSMDLDVEDLKMWYLSLRTSFSKLHKID